MKANGRPRIKTTEGSRHRLAHSAEILRSNAGQAMLELALLLPMLLLLTMGVIEMGRYMYIYILVGNAARAGAAYGAQSLGQSGDTPDIQTAAQNDYNSQSNGQAAGSLTVNSSTSCGCDSAGTVTGAICSTVTNPSAGKCGGGGHWVVTVSVTASGTFKSLFNYPGVPASIDVSNTATMRVAPI
jgi:Flp pilus assembly protein TadG